MGINIFNKNKYYGVNHTRSAIESGQ